MSRPKQSTEYDKETLNLTVLSNFKRMAVELAKNRRRSVSALFEDLVEEAYRNQTEETLLLP